MAKAKKTKRGKVAAEIGAGLLAAGAAAAAGYYFYGSKSAAKHRKVAAKWAGDMKKEVIREAKRLEKVSPQNFAKVVDAVAKTYQGARSINAADLKRAAAELKANWKLVQGEVEKSGKKAVKKVKKVAKKAKAKARKIR